MQEPLASPETPTRGTIIKQKISDRTDYTAKPDIFVSLIAFDVTTAFPAMRVSYELGMDQDTPSIRLVVDRMGSGDISGIGYDIFILCSAKKDCLTPHNDDIIVGSVNGHFSKLTATGYNYDIVDSALSVFKQGNYKYFGFGILDIHFKKAFKIELDQLTNNRISFKFSQIDSVLHYVKCSYFLSNWGKSIGNNVLTYRWFSSHSH